jgi:hypothetical protein
MISTRFQRGCIALVFSAIFLTLSSKVFAQAGGFWLPNQNITVCTMADIFTQFADMESGLNEWANEIQSTMGLTVSFDPTVDAFVNNQCAVNFVNFDSTATNPTCGLYAGTQTPIPYCNQTSGYTHPVTSEYIITGGNMYFDSAYWGNRNQWERRYAGGHEFGHQLGLGHGGGVTMTFSFPGSWSTISAQDATEFQQYYNGCSTC